MYFWRIKSLKRDLAAGAVSERNALPYLLWLGGLTSLASSLPLGELNGWDFVAAISSVGLFVAGTSYAFRCNGGSAGAHFLVRYLCLNWVLGLRLLVLFAVPGIVVLVPLEELLLEQVPPDTTPLEAGFLVVFESVLYWRLAVHIRDVAAASRAA